MSSIVSYGLSTISRQPAPGVSSLSSIVGYGLSTIARQPTPGVSSLSSIVGYGLSTIARQPTPGVSSLSSIVAYGLSSLGGQTSPGISSLSSSVSYGLSSFIIPLSTFSTAISTRFTTSSLEANVISSSYGLFSTLSTGSILIGYNTSPLQVAVGVTTVDLIASNITVNYGYVTANLGVGKEAPYWYALDVSGTSRLPIISSVTVTANSFIGDGSGVTNVQNAGVSSLSSIISYGLSTIARQPAPGVSSLSSIIAYGLSTVARQPAPGVSSISSIIAYGLSSVAAGPGVSSLSSIISFGLSTVAAGATNPGVSSLSSIIGFGLLSVAAGSGVSSLSSIIAYGLSSVAAGSGVSSISSIIAYGLSSVAAGSGVSSISSIIAYGLSSVAAGATNPGVSTLSSIVAYGLSTVAQQPAPGVSSLSSIISYGLSSFTLIANISSLNTNNISAATSFISSLTVNALQIGTGDGFINFPAIRAIAVSSIQENTGSLYAGNAYIGTTSTVNGVFFAGLSNTFDRTIITEISTSVAGNQELLLYKGGTSTDRIRLQTTGEIRFESGQSIRTWPFNTQAVAPTLYAGITNQVGINTATPGTNITLDVVGASGAAGTIRTNILSSQQLFVSSIAGAVYQGDGSQLSNIGGGLSTLSSIVSYGLSSLVDYVSSVTADYELIFTTS